MYMTRSDHHGNGAEVMFARDSVRRYGSLENDMCNRSRWRRVVAKVLLEAGEPM